MNKLIHLVISVCIAIGGLGIAQAKTNASVQEKGAKKSSSLISVLKQDGYTAYPLIYKKNLLYTKASVDGHPVLFLIDTGSTGASLLKDGINKLGLTPKTIEQKSANMTGKTLNKAEVVELKQVEIGRMMLGEIHAGIIQEPFSNSVPTVVVGCDFLKKYHAIIDLNHDQLFLTKTALSRKQQFGITEYLNKTYQAVPLTSILGEFILPVSINKKPPVNVLFDTGTSDMTLSFAYAKAINIKNKTAVQQKKATNGNISIADIELRTIAFNPLQAFFQSPITLKEIYASSANINFLQHIFGVVGIIGLKEIRQINAVIDIPSSMIFLKAS